MSPLKNSSGDSSQGVSVIFLGHCLLGKTGGHHPSSFHQLLLIRVQMHLVSKLYFTIMPVISKTLPCYRRWQLPGEGPNSSEWHIRLHSHKSFPTSALTTAYPLCFLNSLHESYVLALQDCSLLEHILLFIPSPFFKAWALCFSSLHTQLLTHN